MLIKEQFIEPFIVDVYHDGFQIKEKNEKNESYQPIGKPIYPKENLIPVLTQLILSRQKNREMSIVNFTTLENEIKNELTEKFTYHQKIKEGDQ
jgi:hypothetical protein